MKIKPIFIALMLLVAFALPAQNTIGCAASSNAKTVPVTTKTGTSAIFTQPTPVKVPPTGPTGPNADKRFVFWMHGLGGDDGAWQDAFAATETNVANGYPARDCYNRTMDYANFTSGISNAGAQIKTKMEDLSDGKTQDASSAYRNFAIAHSQGGLVARAVDRIFDAEGNSTTNFRRMGGIVTFGTAHKGAMIINNVVPQNGGGNMMEQFTSDACKDLKAGWAAEIDAQIQSSWLLRLFLDGNFVERVTDTLCDKIGVNIPKFAFKDFNQNITQDYKVGSAYLDSLNKDTSSIHHLAFYGVEDDETMAWRTMHYLFNKPNDEDYFDANHDSIGVAWANENRQRYIARAIAWGNVGFVFGQNLPLYTNNPAQAELVCTKVGLPANCLNVFKDIPKIQLAWARGINWWNTANDRYRALIGALEYQTLSAPECWCTDCLELAPSGACNQWTEPYLFDLVDCSMAPSIPGRNCSVRETQFVVKNTKPADGIVLAESAGAYPIGNGQYAPSEVMKGSNHQQMRNDRNTREKLFSVFEGTKDGWFKTLPK